MKGFSALKLLKRDLKNKLKEDIIANIVMVKNVFDS